jgi:hypothetical protein
MSTDQFEPDDSPDEEVDIPLTETARYTVTLGTQFSYRGHNHWPKVEISDSIGVTEDERGEAVLEDSDDLIFRVEEMAHRRLGIIIARMKREIDKRVQEDLAARTPAPAPSGDTQ